MKRYSSIILLALGHGLNDLIAGYFLGLLIFLKADLLMISSALVIYNLIAFGGQYPFALWIEKQGRHKYFLCGAYALNILAIVLFKWNPMLAIVLAGIGSAAYHVAGGAVCAQHEKAFPIGVFAAPGVVGLIVGGYLAWTQTEIMGGLLIAALSFSFLLLRTRIQIEKTVAICAEKEGAPVFDRHDLIMIILLTVIALRSAIWNIFQLIHDQQYEWLFAIAIAAAIGKLAGGWIADRIGWRLYLFISLSIAAPLVSFFRNDMILFCIGIGLLQSGIPASTALMIQSAKGRKERGIGLAFGTAIIIGAIVLYLPGGAKLLSPTILMSATLVMLTLFYFTRGKKALFEHPSR